MKIRTALVVGGLETGGTEKQIVELASRLDRGRFEPIICGLYGGGPLETVARDLGIQTVVLGRRSTRPDRKVIRMIRALLAWVRLTTYLVRNRPDVVHAFLYWAYVPGAFAARLAGVPIFISSRRGLGVFKDGKPYLQWLENVANGLTTMVLVNSQALYDDVLRRERIDAARVRLIYNGVQIDRPPIEQEPDAIRGELGIPSDAPVVGNIANLIPYKGHRDLIQAWALVAKRYPGAYLLLVGRDGGIGADLQQVGRELGVGDRVILAGARDDIAEILQAIDIQVLSSHQEGFSNAILEGMVAGKPLVVTDVGGNAEAVENGVTGWVVPPHDPPAMAEALLRLLDDPEQARRMGAAGRQRACDRFGMDRMVNESANLYVQLAQQKGLGAVAREKTSS